MNPSVRVTVDAGGTTCTIDFAIPQKGGTLKEALAQWRAEHPGSRVTTAEIERRVRTLPSGRVQFSFLVVQY